MPIQADPDGTLDIENATLRSRGIVALTNMVAGNDVVRSGGPALEVYGDPGPRLELVSNTAATDGTATFTRLESNVGVFSIQSGTDGATNGPITFGGFANERMRIDADGNVGVGTNAPVGVNGGKCLEGSSSTGFEYIATRDDTAADADDFVGAYLFKNADTDGNAPHYAGVSAKISGTNGPMNLSFFANRDNYESDTPDMIIKSNGNVGIGTTNPTTKFTLYGNSTPDEGGLLMKVVDDVNLDNGFTGIGLGGYATGITQVAKSAIIHERNAFYGRGNLMFCNSDDGDVTDVSNTHARMTITSTGDVGIGTTDPAEKLDVQGSALITGLTYGIKSTGTLGSDRTEDWYRLLIGGIRSGNSAIRTKCKLQLLASGLHQTLTFDFNHMISLSETSGNSFNLLGNDHYVSRAGVIKLRLADAGSNQIALDMYINHDIVSLGRDWTITLYTEGGSLISEASPFLQKITAAPSTSIEISTDTTIFGIVGSTTSETLVMHENGNVGIGETNPASKLQVRPTHTTYSNPDATSGLYVYNKLNSDADINHSIVALRTGGSSGGDPFISFDIASEHGWVFGIDNSAGTQLRFSSSWSNFGSTRGYISATSTVDEIDFTGQHRSFIDTLAHTDYLKYEGLIVSANKNQYFDIQEEVVTGVQAIKINESLPLVSISNVAYDKCCFGVISGSEDTNDREYSQGSFVSVMKKQEGDIRAHINSVGEGAIWVVNTNGSLESGDYITTSNVMGYGQKQDSEFLANYTVAKITMDCDFEPVTQPVRRIIRELKDVTYWVKYTYEDITEEEYIRIKNLGRRVRIIESGTEISQEEYENHLKKEGYTLTESNTFVRNETSYQRVFSDKEKKPTPGFNIEIRNELVNVLDEHGQIQWEDDPSGATEKAYKIRYLDADGNITDEANHVYKAAFVGCTYHCG